MSISEIASATWEYREKKPSDAVADNIPLLFALRRKNRVKTINGGRVIYEPIKYAQNAYVQHIDPTQQITIGYNQTLTSFEYSPKIIVVPTTINALEQAQNQGDAQWIDLLDERLEVGEESLYNQLEVDLQGDGTGFSGKAFPGIRAYIVDSVTGGSYGGLSRSAYTSIRNISVDAPSTFTGDTDSSNIESRLRYCKNKVVRQTDKPDLLLMGEDYYNAGSDAMSAKQRFTQNKDMVEANFDNYVIEGMTAVLANGRVFSGLSHIAVDRCYGINTMTMAMKMYKGFNFQPLPKRVSVNQLVDVSLMVGIGSFTSNGTGLDFVMYDS